MMDWLPYFSWAPFVSAEKEGFFADEGIEVNVIEPPSVSDPIKLLVTNKVSFAVSYVPALYAARDKGIPVKGVAALQRNLSASLYWLPDSKISSVADLKGKTIALTAKLDERAYVKALLASAGLTMKDVKTVNPGFASSRLLIDKKSMQPTASSPTRRALRALADRSRLSRSSIVTTVYPIIRGW